MKLKTNETTQTNYESPVLVTSCYYQEVSRCEAKSVSVVVGGESCLIRDDVMMYYCVLRAGYIIRLSPVVGASKFPVSTD